MVSGASVSVPHPLEAGPGLHQSVLPMPSHRPESVQHWAVPQGPHTGRTLHAHTNTQHRCKQTHAHMHTHDAGGAHTRGQLEWCRHSLMVPWKAPKTLSSSGKL